eukprot:8761188-Pyramimonas_sp.AAC.1
MAHTLRFHVFFGRPHFRRPPKRESKNDPGAKMQRRTALSFGSWDALPSSTSCRYANWLLNSLAQGV